MSIYGGLVPLGFTHSKTTETFVLLYSVENSIPHFDPFHNFRFQHIFGVKFVELANFKRKLRNPFLLQNRKVSPRPNHF